MDTRTIRRVKPFVFLLCLVPLALLIQRYRTDNLGSDPVNTITHFTGDWALYLLLAGLAISPVRRVSPKLAWLVRFRRMVGLFAFFYATLHLLTYLLLFSGFDLPGAMANVRAHNFAAVRQEWLDVWPTMWADFRKRVFIQVGLLAWVLLLALTVTSPQAVMRRMGGRPWQTLHRLVYGAAALALVHYWFSVKKGNLEPLTVTLVLAALLLARPAWQWYDRRRKATAVSVAA